MLTLVKALGSPAESAGPALFELLPPWRFVRVLTIGLATVWTLRGALRIWRQIHVLDDQAAAHGLRRGLALRASVDVALRTTVLDPLNLALILTLAGLWTL